ncbi:MAG: PD40 domain-containing protein, partial [Phycisphaerales bacterium]|nr:PD40 domain-containing protein [Phycisphaerales bacterium]
MTLFRQHQWLSRLAVILIAVTASRVSAGATPDCDSLLTLVSTDPIGPAPNERCFDVVMTPDAEFVVFTSLADNIIAGDANQGGDVFLLDRNTNQIQNVHVNNAGLQGNKPAGLIGLAVTPDGDKIAFTSEATNLGTQFTGRHIYVRYRQAGRTILASANQADGANPHVCGSPAISDDGRYVAYWAYAEGGGTSQVWVRDIWLGTTTRVSSAPNGAPGNAHSGPKTDNAGGIYPSGGQIAMSADGRFI